MQLKAVVLDMDGLMIDSEPFWRQAEMEFFPEVGIDLTEEMCLLTTGIRIDQVCEYWYRRFPWQGISPYELSCKIKERVIELIIAKGEALPGVLETIGEVKKRQWPLALASSSPMSMIEVVLDKLKIQSHFDVVRSAESEEFGKPHPGVYTSTLNELGVEAEYCMTFEDTVTGVIAAKAASMKVTAIPQAEHKNDPRYVLADFTHNSLLDFDWSLVD